MSYKKFVCSLAVFFLSAFSFHAMAQSYQKHPRAMELERQMTKDALDFLKSRFPDYPVIVTVSIDPLYRVERKQKGQGESLPFFKMEEEEILDEWDDPGLPSSVLLSRVKKVVVNVSVPGHLSDDEVAEIKQSLMLNLNLLPARDNIEILRRSWGQKKEPEFNPMNYLGVGLLIFALFFFSLLAAIWTPIRQIVRVLREGVASTRSQNSSAPNMVMPVSAGGAEGYSTVSRESSSAGGGPKGDVRFSDPIKLQTAISLFLGNLTKVEGFPSLADMIYLDDICKENPSVMGAFLLEAPLAMREKIFSYSYGTHWLEALYRPGGVDVRVFEIAHKLNRMARSSRLQQWELLLLAVWRLGEHRSDFLRELNQGDAFSILYHLPKSIALKTARELWPGSWAILLDLNYQPKQLPMETVVEITTKALSVLPLRTMETLEQFKQDKDLVDFLATVDPISEREIYLACPKDSILHKLRPPFYKVFELPELTLKSLIASIPLSDWALALSNVPQNERKKIETHFSGKQKQRYQELLVQMEAADFNARAVGETRGRIAESLKHFLEVEVATHANATLEAKKDSSEDEKAA